MLSDCCTVLSESIQMDRVRFGGPVRPVPKEQQFGLSRLTQIRITFPGNTVMMRHLLSVRTNHGQQEALTGQVDTIAKILSATLVGIGLEAGLRSEGGPWNSCLAHPQQAANRGARKI